MEYRYTTEHLILVLPSEELAGPVLDYFTRNRADFAQWERTNPPGFFTLDYQRQALAAEQKLYLRSSGLRYYIFEKSNPDAVIGNVSFAYLTEDEGHRCALGYRMDKNYRRRGYAYEAVSFLLPRIHASYKVKRIEADILEENTASLALIKKLGFEYEGVARCAHSVAGIERDHLRFSYIFVPHP